MSTATALRRRCGEVEISNFEEILAGLTSVQHADEIPKLLSDIAEAFGMKTVAYLGTGTLDRRLPKREPYLAVTYSSEWIEHYRMRGYLKIDPAIQVGLRRLLPIEWDDFTVDGALQRFFGEAAEFGLGRKGISFPVHGHGGDRALFSVSAEMTEREWKWARRTAFRQLPVIATHLHDAVLRTDGLLKARPRLSRREIDCLRWTSEGKTVWECGVILSLSPHTVRCYLESARHKLGASSNTHAVSLALTSGLLFDLP